MTWGCGEDSRSPAANENFPRLRISNDMGGTGSPIARRQRGIFGERRNSWKPTAGDPSELGLNRFHDLIRIRELARLKLRVNLLAIDRHVENPTGGRYQLQRPDILLEFEQLLRQTDGTWLKVSHRAVLDSDFHAHGFRR